MTAFLVEEDHHEHRETHPRGLSFGHAYLIVRGAAKALDFYKRAFGATELFRMESPDGRIGHAEIKIGDSPIMLAYEHPEIGAKGPESWVGQPLASCST